MTGSAYRQNTEAVACATCGEHLRKEDALLSMLGAIQCRRCGANERVAGANDVLRHGPSGGLTSFSVPDGSHGAKVLASFMTLSFGVLLMAIGATMLGVVFFLVGAIWLGFTDMTRKKKP